MARIAVLSDIHLSPTHGFFWENWCVGRDFINETEPHAAIINGDLCINGPDSDAELAFAAWALRGLRGQVLPLPGNHDIGDEPPGQDSDQIINQDRLTRWDETLGRDRWTHETGDWLLIGINAQLFGSGLAREIEQNRWLDEQLASAASRHTGLFLHKPIFLEDPSDDEPTVACIVPAARRELLERLHDAGVRFVVSGHLHQYRDRFVNGIRHVWSPAVAFAAPHTFGGDGNCGVLFLNFVEDQVDIAVHRPDGLVSHELEAIKEHGRHKFLRDMPPSPPRIELTEKT